MLSSWSFGKFGDGLQDVLEAAPYYLLGQDTVPVDVLQLLPASVNVTTNTAQGVFQSANHTTSTALITLVVSSITQTWSAPPSCLHLKGAWLGAKQEKQGDWLGGTKGKMGPAWSQVSLRSEDALGG